MTDEKKSYPMMPVNNWLTLRKKFRATLPKEVTPAYLAGVLGMGEASAQNNILPSLRITGLVDKDGKPTDRAVKWRDDTQYSQTCQEIRQEVYPQELLDLAPDATVDRSVVNSWFANKLGVGESAARRLSAFYLMLCEADPSKEADTPTTAAKSTRNKTIVAKRPKKLQARPKESTSETDEVEPETPKRKQPSIHLDIQIHISPEASTDQIDQIFASMAKHLRDFV